MIDQSVPFGKNIFLKVLIFFSQSIHFFLHFSSEVKYKVYQHEKSKNHRRKKIKKKLNSLSFSYLRRFLFSLTTTKTI